MEKRIKQIIADQLCIEAGSISLDTDLKEDLGADSLDIVELAMAISEEFSIDDIEDDVLVKMKTVRDVVTHIEKEKSSGKSGTEA